MRKLAIMLSASALLLGLAAASANAQTQTGASRLRALMLNATPVVKTASCPKGWYWLCKPDEDAPSGQRCSCKHY